MTNRIFAFLFLGICIESVQLQALNWFIPRSKTIDTVLALFLKKYAPPAEVIEQLDKTLTKQNFGRHPQLPDYFFKDSNTSRLINAIRLKNFIKKEGLTFLDVPEKYIYCKDNECTIIAELIKEGHFPQNRESVAEELLTVAEQTGFSDWHQGNIIPSQNEKMYLIDTENSSFMPHTTDSKWTTLEAVKQLKTLFEHKKIVDRLNVLENDEEASTKVITPIYNNSLLDPEDFDLEEIRAKLYAYTHNLPEFYHELNHELMCSLGNQFK